MAKSDKGRVRVFFAEFDGTDETLQEGMKALTAAVQRTFQAPQREIKFVSLPSGTSPEDVEEFIEDDAEEQDNGELFGQEVRKPASKSKPRKSPSYKFVPDLNLRPQGKESLKEFVSCRTLDDNQELTVAFVYYLQKVIGVEKVTPDHLYTCYKEVAKPSPTNIGQVATNTANRNGWIIASRTEGYTVTVQGENFIEHDSKNGGNDD